MTGKRAFVTGAGRGIGKAIALGLAGFGAHAGLISRTTSKLKEVAWEVEKMGGRAVVAAADFNATGEI